jgi:hypothetical protein
MKERLAATIYERRRSWCKAQQAKASASLLCQTAALKRMGFSQKTERIGAAERDEWRKATWRVSSVVSEEVDPQRFVFVDEMGTAISLSVLGAWVASWTERM